MNIKQRITSHKMLFLPPVLVGIAVLVWMTAGRQPPAMAERGEPTRSVRIIEVPLVELSPVAEGYGPVQPARIWAAVSQVAGRVTYVHPRLQDGEILTQGTELVRIDPKNYEIAVTQVQAELRELDIREANASASLAIEKRNLELAQQELERIRKLVKQGTASQSNADETERSMLTYRAAVQNQQNTLSLIPAQRSLLQARLALAGRDLEHTVIQAPFNMRVSSLDVETDQYVPAGKVMFEGDATERVEVMAQVAMTSLRRLFVGRETIHLDFERISEELEKLVALEPLVRLDMGDEVAQWKAEFVRFSERVDPQTRTMGVVVAVDRPFEKIIPGYRPPLYKGMFVQVVLRGRKTEQRLIVPRSAIHDGTIYVVDQDSRLRRKQVKTLFSQRDISVIAEGLEPGDRIVVSDLVPAIDGMLLHTEVDEALSRELIAAGNGS